MKFSCDKHALYPVACTFFTELHLHDGMINGLSGYLSPNHIQFPVRDLKVRRGVFVLSPKVIFKRKISEEAWTIKPHERVVSWPPASVHQWLSSSSLLS